MRLEIAESRCKLMFDRLNSVENTANYLFPVDINTEIARKEGEIERLTREIRHLVSRRVLQEIADMEETETEKVRMRYSKRTGSVTPTRSRREGTKCRESNRGTMDTSVEADLSLCPQSSISIAPRFTRPQTRDCCPTF